MHNSKVIFKSNIDPDDTCQKRVLGMNGLILVRLVVTGMYLSKVFFTIMDVNWNLWNHFALNFRKLDAKQNMYIYY